MKTQIALLQKLPRLLRSGVVGGVQRLGFWGSVLLPFTYLPLLYGMTGSDLLFALAGLLGLNLLCLVVGHGYAQR